jgi:hypothetical protein
MEQSQALIDFIEKGQQKSKKAIAQDIKRKSI